MNEKQVFVYIWKGYDIPIRFFVIHWLYMLNKASSIK